MVAVNSSRVQWILLIYRVPRDPSSPRIAIWRRLRALGVAQLADGVVALPEDARTREHLEWVAEQVLEAGGTAVLLRSQALSRKDERLIAEGMAGARAEEYRSLADQAADAASAASTPAEATRTLKRLRHELRRIQKRDYFPPPERDAARAAVDQLAATYAGTLVPVTSEGSPR